MTSAVTKWLLTASCAGTDHRGPGRHMVAAPHRGGVFWRDSAHCATSWAAVFRANIATPVRNRVGCSDVALWAMVTSVAMVASQHGHFVASWQCCYVGGWWHIQNQCHVWGALELGDVAVGRVMCWLPAAPIGGTWGENERQPPRCQRFGPFSMSVQLVRAPGFEEDARGPSAQVMILAAWWAGCQAAAPPSWPADGFQRPPARLY